MTSRQPQVVVVTGASGGIGRAVAQATRRITRGAASTGSPGILDRYLARTGYKSQQTDQPRDPDQPVNLWEPANGPQGRDFDTHGIFDHKSTSRSYQLWASQHHGLLGAVGAGAAALLGLFVARSRTNS